MIHIYTTSQKFLNSKIFLFFLRILFCSPSLHLFDPKYSKSSNIVKYFYYIIIYILNSKNILQYYCFCCILDQINAGLVSRRDFFKKKNLTVQKRLNGSVYHICISYIYIYIPVQPWWESKHSSSVRAALPNLTVQNGSNICTAHFTAQTNLESATCRTKPVWSTRIQHMILYIEALQEVKHLRWLHT